MDPFEVRMQFLTLISRLSSSLQSLSKVSSFALKHAQKCSDDIWDCYLDELTHSPNLNHRINMLYLLDLVLDKEGPKVVDKGMVGGLVGQGSYRALVERDLGKVLNQVVPESKEGVLNHMSAMQVLKSWKTRRLVDSEVLDSIVMELDEQKARHHSKASESTANGDGSSATENGKSSSTFTNFSRNDILRRIEDDRERHKRLRERIWVLPIPSTIFNAPLLSSALPSSSTKPSPISPASPFEPAPATSLSHRSSIPGQDKDKAAAALASNSNAGRGPELALEIEFDQLWEASEEERRLLLGSEDDQVEGGRERRKVWDLSEGEKAEMRNERRRCFEV